MKTRKLARWQRRLRIATAAGLMSSVFLPLGGCWDSEISKRFREAYAPGFINGLSTALGTAGQAETGLRLMGKALADGIGAIIQPRTSTSSSSSSGSSSSSSGSSSSSSSGSSSSGGSS